MISVLQGIRILLFREDLRRVGGAALKHRSACQCLPSKTVAQEGTEETEGSPLSLFAPVLWFGRGYAALGTLRTPVLKCPFLRLSVQIGFSRALDAGRQAA